jgi:hypothetical protein
VGLGEFSPHAPRPCVAGGMREGACPRPPP